MVTTYNNIAICNGNINQTNKEKTIYNIYYKMKYDDSNFLVRHGINSPGNLKQFILTSHNNMQVISLE